ncbi:MAG: hypothetical protein ABJP70_04620 [Erythrobacter sp.]
MSGSESELVAFAVVANLIDVERVPDGDGVVHRGTKAFSPGTKVYMGQWFWGAPEAGGYAIGRNRVSGRLTKAVVPGFLLNNFRTKSIYSTTLHATLDEREAELFENKDAAQDYAKSLGGLSKYARTVNHGGRLIYIDACDDNHPRP